MDNQLETIFDNSDGITLLGGGGSGGKSGGSSRSMAGRQDNRTSSQSPRRSNATSIDPNAPISPGIAARTTTDLGAPRVSRGFGLRR